MAKRIAEYAHPAVVFWPVNSAVKITGTFERTDCTGWHRRGLRVALRAVGVAGGRQHGGSRDQRSPFDSRPVSDSRHVRFSGFRAGITVVSGFTAGAASKVLVLVSESEGRVAHLM